MGILRTQASATRANARLETRLRSPVVARKEGRLRSRRGSVPPQPPLEEAMKQEAVSTASITPAVLSVAEACLYLNVRATFLRQAIRTGKIPHTRFGKLIRIRIEDLDEAIRTGL